MQKKNVMLTSPQFITAEKEGFRVKRSRFTAISVRFSIIQCNNGKYNCLKKKEYVSWSWSHFVNRMKLENLKQTILRFGANSEM